MINKKINKWIVILLILSIFLSIANFSVFAADNEEPGEQMIGATFSQEFPKLGVFEQPYAVHDGLPGDV